MTDQKYLPAFSPLLGEGYTQRRSSQIKAALKVKDLVGWLFHVIIKMWFHFSAKGPCSLTWHNGLLAVKTLGWVLIRVALSTQQDLVLGSKWFLHKWAAALGTPEAPLMPVAAFVGQILGESKFMLMQTFIYSGFILQVLPELKGKTKSIAVVDPSRSVLRKAVGTPCQTVV